MRVYGGGSFLGEGSDLCGKRIYWISFFNHFIVSLSNMRRGIWIWLMDQSGLYLVKLANEVIITHNVDCQRVEILDNIWNLKLPPKVNFFLRRVLINRLQWIICCENILWWREMKLFIRFVGKLWKL